MSEKRKCDCWLDVGMCHCGFVYEPEVFEEVDPMYKKIPYNRSITRRVALEFENVLLSIGVTDVNKGLEIVMEGFIRDVRDMQKDELPAENFMGRKIDWDIN